MEQFETVFRTVMQVSFTLFVAVLLAMGAMKLRHRRRQRTTPRDILPRHEVPLWAIWAAWITAIVTVLGAIFWMSVQLERRDHTPQPEQVMVVQPVSTTDDGTRLLLILNRRGATMPVICHASECDEFRPSELITADAHFNDEGVAIYENPRRE